MRIKPLIQLFLLLILGSFLTEITQATTSYDFSPVKKLILADQIDKAIKKMKDIPIKKLNSEDQQLHAFTMAFLYTKTRRPDKVKLLLSKDKNPLRKEYRHFLLGQASYKMKDYANAEKEFENILQIKPQKNLLYNTYLEAGRVAIEAQNWKKARKYLRFIEKKWRNTYRHPEVLWHLIKVELNRKQSPCSWVRKIYTKYPAHPLVYDWNIDLKETRYDGHKLNCKLTLEDHSKRIRRLQWSGESLRAHQEIRTLRSQATDEIVYQTDSLFVRFLINEGDVDEAMKILTPYYEEKSDDIKYLDLLAKAASRSGKYPLASNSYYKAHQLSSKKYLAQEALFNAAFLGYQFRDYDGASRKFIELMDKYKNPRINQDSQNYLAWLHYLKGNYSVAIQKFNEILEQKKKKPHLWKRHQEDKFHYWIAMSYKQLKNNKKSYQLFRKLEVNGEKGFYSIASKYRAISTPIQHQTRTPSSVNKDDLNSASLLPTPTPSQIENLTSNRSPKKNSETLEDPNLLFKKPKLRNHFYRANSFIRVGILNWAKWELYEIERQTTRKSQLKKLIHSYEEAGFLNRSAYISAIFFSEERQSGGYEHPLWSSAYPRAYRDDVEASAKEFGVPPELIWSIMRTETFFNEKAISAVGARGLMQLMPHTARKVTHLIDEQKGQEPRLLKPKINIRLGSRYLKRLLTVFNGNIPLAAAAYNAGPHRVKNWLNKFGNLEMDEFIEHIPYKETRNYAKKVINNFSIYKQLYSKDKNSLAWLSQPINVKVEDQLFTRENWEPLSPRPKKISN